MAAFDARFRRELAELFRWRRDVRRFRTDPVPAELVEELLRLADLAPSVGNSQPWRFVLVEDAERRRRVRQSFERVHRAALAGYAGERAPLYASLKLEGMDRAPVQIAVFCDEATSQGHGLGRPTMPETLCWSVVLAVGQLWLAARAFGLGMGWVSILDPGEVTRILEVPDGWRFVAWLCLGWPEEEHTDPELERAGWQARTPLASRILRR
ncbi:5,6-dimethylbenzimidazole synthase [bacterium HR39]|nr:5,6-dimethylbenzimidazole synthase [bacterium HR39]